ncbi:MAG: ATP synthase F1 subunit delta [Thermoanaerobaculia bacterium]
MVRRFARPYARAIIDVAGSAENANAIRRELDSFERARTVSPELPELYANPGIDLEVKLSITRQIAAKLGLTPGATKVLEVLVRNHRINDTGAIAEALASYVNEALNVAVADVRSAHPLSDAEVADLRGTLEQRIGRKVEVRVQTDPELLGGFVVQVGSEVLDASVTGKINRFRASLA